MHSHACLLLFQFQLPLTWVNLQTHSETKKKGEMNRVSSNRFFSMKIHWASALIWFHFDERASWQIHRVWFQRWTRINSIHRQFLYDSILLYFSHLVALDECQVIFFFFGSLQIICSCKKQHFHTITPIVFSVVLTLIQLLAIKRLLIVDTLIICKTNKLQSVPSSFSSLKLLRRCYRWCVAMICVRPKFQTTTFHHQKWHDGKWVAGGNDEWTIPTVQCIACQKETCWTTLCKLHQPQFTSNTHTHTH